MLKNISRPRYEKEISNFLVGSSKNSGFAYVRGRRRVGKSTILKHIATENPKKVFYFLGVLDERTTQTIKRFALEWKEFSNDDQLTNLASHALTWDKVFGCITKYAQEQRPLAMIIDEIQWIAKGQNGFVGILKNNWLEWERTGRIRIIVCGSSNRFFEQNVGGEEKILRGIRTRSDIWIRPLSLQDIRTHYTPHWSLESTVFAYTLIGGIPYYWNQVRTESNPLQALNQACFTHQSIFLDEVDEVLKLEFNRQGVIATKNLLNHLSPQGMTLDTLCQKAAIPTASVMDTINKLIDYSIVYSRSSVWAKPLMIKRGAQFYLKDFYLNFYFFVIHKHLNEIKKNRSRFLIADYVYDSENLLIPDYSGYAFERLVCFIFENPDLYSARIFQRLKLKKIQFDIGSHWDDRCQIDIVLHNCSDRQVRLIECKWTHSMATIKEGILQLAECAKYLRSNPQVNLGELPFLALISNATFSKSIHALAKKHKILLLGLEDLL